ncbi:MAG: 1-acyl-sn-glycerol-3-phosphate acyltransferase [Proteobacteria bacterium]|nr:1-acyl-sn-glycerol-3-phosphate acyltransferase [Pseudomonadota bacterium]
MPPAAESPLPPTERLALALTRLANEPALSKWLQSLYLRHLTWRTVHALMARRVFIDGLATVRALAPERGVIVASNHRTFFDLWVSMLPIFAHGDGWLRRAYFPVRSGFFYDSPLGLLVNLAVGGGSMYPPVFRERGRAALNQDAVQRLERALARPGTVVGMHPEGRRNIGDDPYALLPAQPGIGQLLLRARPLLLPVFVNGLTNRFWAELGRSLAPPAQRRRQPVIVVVGSPLDLSRFDGERPRATVYKRIADFVMEAVGRCGARERELRARLARGDAAAGEWLV